MHILKKAGKVFLYILLGIIILLFVVGLFLDPIAKRVLENQVAKADEGQYSLTLDAVDVSILGGTFRMHGMVFETDTVHSETPPIAFITADEIAVEGVSWLRYLLSDKLSMEEVRMDNLNVSVYARQLLDETKDKEKPKENTSPFRLRDLDIYPAIRDQVDRLHLKDLTFNDLSLTLANVSTQDTLTFNAKAFHVNSNDIVIDANKLITDNRAFYATYINFEGEEIEVNMRGNQLTRIETEFFRFATREQMMNILVKGVEYLDSNLAKQDTLIYAALQDFSLVNLDMKRLQAERTGYVDNINLTALDLVSKMPMQQSADTTQAPQEKQINLAELSFGEKMPEVMDRLVLDQLDIREVNVRQAGLLSLLDFNLNVQEIVVDEQPAFANNRFMHAAMLETDFEALAMGMDDPAQEIRLQGFAMNVDQGIGNIGFTNLMVMPQEKPENEVWFETEIGPFNLIRLDTRNLINRQLAIDSIGIDTPKIMAHIPPTEKKGEQKEFKAPDLYPAIAAVLDSLYLRKVAVVGASMELSGMDAIEDSFEIPALYLQLRDVLVAEGTAFEGNRVLHSEDIAFRVENINYHFPKGGYELSLEFARFSTFEQFLELGKTDYSYEKKAENQEILKAEEDNMLMAVSNEHFRIDNLNFQQLLLNQAFFAGSVKAEGLDVYVYVDNNYPLEEEAEQTAKKAAGPAAKKMPQELLKNLDLPLHLESFSLNSGKIVYEQLLKGADTAGVMEITNFYVNGDNITNQEEKYRQNREITLEIGGKIMGDGDFETAMVFDMLSDSNSARLTGNIDSLDLTTLNEFTTYTSRLALRSGQLHTLNWDIEADSEAATGTMEMYYEDLNMRISGSDHSDTTGVLKDIGAFLANNLVLETDVQAEDPEGPEETEVEVEKEEKDGFLDLYVKSLADGLLDLMLTISFLL